jgi:hypothetical protein
MNKLRPMSKNFKYGLALSSAVAAMPGVANVKSEHVQRPVEAAKIGRLASFSGGAPLSGEPVTHIINYQTAIGKLVFKAEKLGLKESNPNSGEFRTKKVLSNGATAEVVVGYPSPEAKSADFIGIVEGRKIADSSNNTAPVLSFEFQYSPQTKTWSSMRGLAIPHKRNATRFIGENFQRDVIISNDHPKNNPGMADYILQTDIHQAGITLQGIGDGRPSDLEPLQ